MEEIVHIIPLGHEIDRAVKPFEKYKANRVHILSVLQTFKKYSLEMVEEQKYFTDTVADRLRSFGIGITIHTLDMFNVLEVIKKISNIIYKEKTMEHCICKYLQCGKAHIRRGLSLRNGS